MFLRNPFKKKQINLTSKEIITKEVLIKCPFCKEEHTYQIDIESTGAVVHGIIDNSSKVIKRITKLFICPTTNKEYQADLILQSDIIDNNDQLEFKKISSDIVGVPTSNVQLNQERENYVK